jgi:hypothetical protein
VYLEDIGEWFSLVGGNLWQACLRSVGTSNIVGA